MRALLMTLISVALFGCGSGDTVACDCSTSMGGDGGEAGGGGEGGSGGGGSTAAPECVRDEDCAQSGNLGCGQVTCKAGVCVEETFSPEYTCTSPDPDDAGPWPAQGGTYHCDGHGQCCFTCIVDSGSNQSEFDQFDGPCVAGTSDDFCGHEGGLCQNCKILGMLCVAGECVMDP